MRLLNKPFKLILPLLFLFTAFTVDAQFKSRVVLTSGDTGDNICTAVNETDNYVFGIDLTLWDLNYIWTESSDATTGETTWELSYEPLCDMHMGVVVENYDSQNGSSQTLFLEYFFELDFDVNNTPIDPISGGTNTTSIFINEGPIEEMFCSEESNSLYFTFNLYCLEDGVYTEINPCDEEFESFFNLEEGECDLSTTIMAPLCCDLDSPEGDGENDYIDFGLINQDNKFDVLVDINQTYNSIELINQSGSQMNYQIMTISGKIINQGNLATNNGIQDIDISYLEHGLYVFTYGNNTIRESIKFVR